MRSGGVRFSDWPRKVTDPWLARRRPEMVRSVVLLPAPFAPMRVTISPSSMLNEMPRTARMAP